MEHDGTIASWPTRRILREEPTLGSDLGREPRRRQTPQLRSTPTTRCSSGYAESFRPTRPNLSQIRSPTQEVRRSLSGCGHDGPPLADFEVPLDRRTRVRVHYEDSSPRNLRGLGCPN